MDKAPDFDPFNLFKLLGVWPGSQQDFPGLEPELDHVQVLSIDSIRPAPENANVYNNISADDPEVVELALSIKERGIQEPLLVSKDRFIISGHRRFYAAHLIGLREIPVRVRRTTNRAEFLRLLVEMNSQRKLLTNNESEANYAGGCH